MKRSHRNSSKKHFKTAKRVTHPELGIRVWSFNGLYFRTLADLRNLTPIH